MENKQFPDQLMQKPDHEPCENVRAADREAFLANLLQVKRTKDSVGNIAYGSLFQPTTHPTSRVKNGHLTPPSSLPALFNPKLESITVKMADKEDLNVSFGQGWIAEVTHTERNSFDFELCPIRDISTAQAWNFVHQLRSNSRVLFAEPSWEIDLVAEETRPPSAELSAPHPETKNKFWAPEMIRIQQAWETPLPTGGRVHGDGIRIAHMDTGCSRYLGTMEQMGGLTAKRGFDFLDADMARSDKSSVHAAHRKTVTLSSTEGDIQGIAPKAALIPMRVALKGPFSRPDPLLVRASIRPLRKAIEMAIDTDCHIITISHGWFGHSALHDVIRRAWKKNIIVIAAAGNYTGPVISAPAKYRESICVAGCNAQGDVWAGSAFGPRADFCAPAQDVWKAGYVDQHALPMQSSGTAFSAALTAGVAALWLAFHGRDTLIAQYEKDNIPLAEVFRSVMKSASDTGPWPGVGGVINAEKALNTPLPSPAKVMKSYGWESLMGDAAETNSPSLATTLEIMGHDYRLTRRQLAFSLNTTENRLEHVAKNCGDELAFHLHLLLTKSKAPCPRPEDMPKLEMTHLSNRLKAQLTSNSCSPEILEMDRAPQFSS